MDLEQIIIETLYELNTCKWCIRRYLATNESIVSKIDKFLDSFSINKVKRYKACPCRSCLDVMSYIESSADKTLQYLKNNNYDRCSVRVVLPKAVQLRDKSFTVYLTEKYPEYYKDREIEKPLGFFLHHYKTLLLNLESSKTYCFTLCFDYKDDEKECLKIIKKGVTAFQLIEKLKFTNNNIIKKYIGVPPDTPLHPVTFTYEFKIKEVNIGGRYLKLDKNIGQIQFKNYFKSAFATVFQGSESDVKIECCGSDNSSYRTLGMGRPFCATISHPKVKPTDNCLENIIEMTNKWPEVKIFKLAYVTPQDLVNMKVMEKTEPRTLRMICKLERADQVAQAVDKISRLDPDGFIINQKTPLSVTTRRVAECRKKKIHNLVASAVPDYPDLLDLTLTSECGTYTDEFVHGDFGRTTPSIRELIDCEIVVLSRDTLEIVPNFPPQRNDSSIGSSSSSQN